VGRFRDVRAVRGRRSSGSRRAPTIAVSRRDFLKIGAGTAAGVTLAGLVDLGLDQQKIQAHAADLRLKDAKQFASVCPYCAVGCGQIVSVKDDKIISIEGNPDSPLSGGTLCPKGAATYQLAVNDRRLTKVLHRKPYATAWEEMDLEKAMDRIAELTKKTRDDTFVEKIEGQTVNHTLGIFSLGGATLDNEENYMIMKVFRGGLGMPRVENQARI
jgi:formate dehydrogenase major subunit